MNLDNLVLSAASERIKLLEDRMERQDQQISHIAMMISKVKEDSQIDKIASIIDSIRLTVPIKTIADHIQGGSSPIEIPKELLPTAGKCRARGNRTFAVVNKRWALWKVQFEAGMCPTQIAKAWGCDRSSVIYARENRFVTRASNGRKLVEFPKSMRSAMRSKQRSIK